MRRRPRPKTAILVLLLPLVAILLGSALMWRFATATARSVASIPSEPIFLGEPLPEPAAPALVLEEPAPALAESAFLVITGILRPGQTLGASLREQGVTAGTIDQVSSELSSVFNFRYAKPGDSYRLLRNGDGRVVDFEFVRSPRESYRLRLDGDRYVAEKHAVEVTRRATRIAGLVSTSLHEAILDLGESAELAGDFAEIFAWDVDFSRAVQPGDEFQILYERMYAPGRDGIEEYLGPGRILAAHYDGAAGDHTAVHFEFAEGRGGYYRPDGSSIRRQFLQAPLKFSRISSRYTQARFHPILKITRPHHGIDYAAPAGTPVFSVADGTVVHMGWSGGYGRLVKIRHADGYVSFYGHLSRYAPGLRVGKTVQQKQQIGSVGSSGLSTGPHVCFRITKNGRFVNPATQNVPNSPPIPGNAVAEFQTTRDARLAELGTPLVVTQEAL